MWSRSSSCRILKQFCGSTSQVAKSGRWSRPITRLAALWGNGDFGRLGLGDLNSQSKPSFCPPSAFDHQNLRAIACGGAHTLFLTENGSVYAAGLNDFGQLGVSNSIDYATGPRQIAGLPKEIIQIAAGYHHSAAISADGELYLWGKNLNGQLGLGKKSENIVFTPTKVDCLNGITIRMVALGSEHSIAVTDNGEALSWGQGDSGRLGHGHNSSFLGFLKSSSEYTPRLIKSLEGVKVKFVAAGLLHTACIAENGSVFLFGERTLPSLGFSGRSKLTTPTIISNLPYSEEVACGAYHTCVITGIGDLYAWGSNDNGCLGIGCTDVFHLPERVEGPFLKSTVSKVSCGWKHTAAVSGGKVFTWGWGGSHGTFSEDGFSSGGQLGHGDDVDYISPSVVEFGRDLKAVSVSCGFNHTGAILETIN
uniref:RCC1-like domain-containing protein n=1 Tax=Kalanchoe fedtschenkoi TaxID=63787 RepID=A0A7N0U0P0_KALFE